MSSGANEFPYDLNSAFKRDGNLENEQDTSCFKVPCCLFLRKCQLFKQQADFEPATV